MSDGATMSAPARACDTATCASSSSVTSLSTCAVEQHAAVAVGGVLAEADVGDQDQLGHRLAHRAQRRAARRRPRHTPRGRPRPCTPAARTGSPPGRRRACSSAHSDTSSSTERWYWPGIEGIGSRRPEPCRTNSGAIRSAGDSRVSRTIDRSASVRRNRRILVAGKRHAAILVAALYMPRAAAIRLPGIDLRGYWAWTSSIKNLTTRTKRCASWAPASGICAESAR